MSDNNFHKLHISGSEILDVVPETNVSEILHITWAQAVMFQQLA